MSKPLNSQIMGGRGTVLTLQHRGEMIGMVHFIINSDTFLLLIKWVPASWRTWNVGQAPNGRVPLAGCDTDGTRVLLCE